MKCGGAVPGGPRGRSPGSTIRSSCARSWTAACRAGGRTRRPPRTPPTSARPVSRWPAELPLAEAERRRLAAALEIGRRVFGDGGPALRRPADVFEWCVELRFARRERFVAYYLDARHRVRRRRLISVGTLTASLVHPREVLAPAVRHRAAALVAVHNHPSGDPEPSPEDVSLTERLRGASELLGVELLDHVVVARGGFVSLRERGVL